MRYLIVIDFEATCDEPEQIKPIEVIEFPAMVIDISSREIIATFHHYVKPQINPILTKFCTDLTGITQETVDNGLPFETVYNKFVNEFLPTYQEGFNFVICGDWDLKTMLPLQLNLIGQNQVPEYFHSWINLKKVSQTFAFPEKIDGMHCLMKLFNLEFIGRQHSGIDDTYNIARCCIAMMEQNLIKKWTPTTYKRGITFEPSARNLTKEEKKKLNEWKKKRLVK
jgi:inhibitor of KinA sporulation pathway (predicted exonuclease)